VKQKRKLTEREKFEQRVINKLHQDVAMFVRLKDEDDFLSTYDNGPTEAQCVKEDFIDFRGCSFVSLPIIVDIDR